MRHSKKYLFLVRNFSTSRVLVGVLYHVQRYGSRNTRICVLHCIAPKRVLCACTLC